MCSSKISHLCRFLTLFSIFVKTLINGIKEALFDLEKRKQLLIIVVAISYVHFL